MKNMIGIPRKQSVTGDDGKEYATGTSQPILCVMSVKCKEWLKLLRRYITSSHWPKVEPMIRRISGLCAKAVTPESQPVKVAAGAEWGRVGLNL
jgi:hypothetical protein